jgi:alkylation response protein AidB-like acyl-CoA dehydrogenase
MYVPEPPEHEMLRQTLRRFLERECPRELVRRWDEDDYYPRAAVEKLRELGVFGLTTSEEYGGAGRDIPAALIAVDNIMKRMRLPE